MKDSNGTMGDHAASQQGGDDGLVEFVVYCSGDRSKEAPTKRDEDPPLTEFFASGGVWRYVNYPRDTARSVVHRPAVWDGGLVQKTGTADMDWDL